MSGGSLDYVYHKVDDAVDRIIEEILQPDYYDLETLEILKSVALTTNLMARMLKEVEWLFSGDNGDESFRRNIAEITKEHEVIDYDKFIKDRCQE